MAELKSYERSLERSRASLLREDRPRTFALAGNEWDLLDGVFAPPFSASTGAAMELLDLGQEERAPRSGSLLEVGSGTGVIAVSAALAGCDRVVAVDISEQAVENTRMNAVRHGVADRLDAVQSDLFDALGDGDRFDTVYWHSNFVLAPPDYRYQSVYERAYVDAGYRTHRRFLAESPALLAEGGRVLLQFSDRGDLSALRAIAEECGRDLRVLRSCRVNEGQETVEYLLLESTAAVPNGWHPVDPSCPAA